MPLIFALSSFILLGVGAISYSNYKKDSWEKDIKNRLLEILMTKKTKLEKALYSRIYYTKSVAAYVSIKPNITTPEYYNLAHELINNDSVISTMALSKNCIISALYPPKGHEAAIGLDLLLHPERKEIVQKTIMTHKTFVAGPVELVEGGIAFISYTPIFDKTPTNLGSFWGVTDIVIYRDKLLEQANLKEIESGFLFSIRGYNGLGNEGVVWWGNKKVFEQNPVTVEIDLPYGTWVLGAIPESGWGSYINQDKVLLFLLLSSSFIISFLIWIISRSVVKIKRNEQELSAIIRSMNSQIIEYDQEGRCMKIPPVNAEHQIRPVSELLHKTVYEVFPEKEAKLFHQAILDCLESKKLVVIEYPLQVKGQICWFSARVSWKSEQRVIFHAIDITEQKQAMELILSSELRLKELNATKDKFFSIIAHDLKNPFNAIHGFSNLLVEQIQEKDYEGAEEYAGIIRNSSEHAISLLSNLMEWSRSQTGRLKFNPEMIELDMLVNDVIVLLKESAQNKSITISTENLRKEMAYADRAMIHTVLRNLISNAIKFTFPGAGGKIVISARHTDEEMIISVSDNGVGMKKELIDRLFHIEENVSTSGTQQEEGTGLGLILCKEFVDNHNGRIWAESEVGKGTTFYFTLPYPTDK
ncbi:MAG: ATP-binding protein [Bacteroidales bacterium]|nr:ATP-binding protein [Bacteroidales bacterium]